MDCLWAEMYCTQREGAREQGGEGENVRTGETEVNGWKGVEKGRDVVRIEADR